MAGKFKVVAKNGDSTYTRNDKSGVYEYHDIDFVQEYDNLGDALGEFLTWAQEDADDNVKLVFIPEKIKKGKVK